jgi:tetratricopeptide (TPR) repeat protein
MRRFGTTMLGMIMAGWLTIADFVPAIAGDNVPKTEQTEQQQKVERYLEQSDNYYNDKMYEHAENETRKALSLDPSSIKAYRYLGVYLTFQGKYQEAVKDLAKGVELNQQLPVAQRSYGLHQSYGFALGKLGRWQEAAQQFKLVLEINPDFQKGQRSLNYANKMLAKK